jgi:hypothetical protein
LCLCSARLTVAAIRSVKITFLWCLTGCSGRNAIKKTRCIPSTGNFLWWATPCALCRTDIHYGCPLIKRWIIFLRKYILSFYFHPFSLFLFPTPICSIIYCYLFYYFPSPPPPISYNCGFKTLQPDWSVPFSQEELYDHFRELPSGLLFLFIRFTILYCSSDGGTITVELI